MENAEFLKGKPTLFDPAVHTKEEETEEITWNALRKRQQVRFLKLTQVTVLKGTAIKYDSAIYLNEETETIDLITLRKRLDQVTVLKNTGTFYNETIHQGMEKETISLNAYRKRQPVIVLKGTADRCNPSVHIEKEKTEKITLGAFQQRAKRKRQESIKQTDEVMPGSKKIKIDSAPTTNSINVAFDIMDLNSLSKNLTIPIPQLEDEDKDDEKKSACDNFDVRVSSSAFSLFTQVPLRKYDVTVEAINNKQAESGIDTDNINDNSTLVSAIECCS